MAQYDTTPDAPVTYQFAPHIDPALQWAGKAEGMSFDVPTPSIHIHESIKPHKIIHAVQTLNDDVEEQQLRFFKSPVDQATVPAAAPQGPFPCRTRLCPLVQIDDPEVMAWAVEWIEILVEMVAPGFITPDRRILLNEALKKTITYLS